MLALSSKPTEPLHEPPKQCDCSTPTLSASPSSSDGCCFHPSEVSPADSGSVLLWMPCVVAPHSEWLFLGLCGEEAGTGKAEPKSIHVGIVPDEP